MGLREIVEAWSKIVAYAYKPSRSEYSAVLKIVFLALAAVGGIAFIIRFIFTVFVFPQIS